MMSNSTYPNSIVQFFIDDGIRETVERTDSDRIGVDWIHLWVLSDTVKSGSQFISEVVAESRTLSVVVVHRVIRIRDRVGIKFDGLQGRGL